MGRLRRALTALALLLAIALVATIAPKVLASAEPGVPEQPTNKAGQVNWASAWSPELPYGGDYAKAQFLMATLANLADTQAPAGAVAELGFTVDAHEAIGPATVFGNHYIMAGANTLGVGMTYLVTGSSYGPDARLADIPDPAMLPSNLGTSTREYVDRGNDAAMAYLEAAGNYGSCDGESGPPLWIVGHGEGGAVATVAAAVLASLGCTVAGVVTLGSTRPGLEDFMAGYNSIDVDGVPLGFRTTSWVYDEDIVYCLYPGSAWRHVGLEGRVGNGPITLSEIGSSDHCADIGQLGKKVFSVVKSYFPMIVDLALGKGSYAQLAAIGHLLYELWDLFIGCEAPGSAIVDLLSGGECWRQINQELIDNYGVTYEQVWEAGTQIFLDVLEGAYNDVANGGDGIALVSKNDYAAGLATTWPDPVTRQVQLRIRTPLNSQPTTVREAYNQHRCTATPDATGTAVCDFVLPVGTPLQFTDFAGGLATELAKPDTWLVGTGCTAVNLGDKLACDLTIDGPGEPIAVYLDVSTSPG